MKRESLESIENDLEYAIEDMVSAKGVAGTVESLKRQIEALETKGYVEMTRYVYLHG